LRSRVGFTLFGIVGLADGKFRLNSVAAQQLGYGPVAAKLLQLEQRVLGRLG
jgi:hypothetical protein